MARPLIGSLFEFAGVAGRSTLERIPEPAENHKVLLIGVTYIFHPRFGVKRQDIATFAASYVQGEA